MSNIYNYINMYLFHVTTIKSLKQILLDGELKSASLTGKINEGSGIYKPSQQKYVFFSTIDKQNNKEIYGDVILFFDSKLLYNRSYYISTVHSPDVTSLGEWFDISGNRNYKLKYSKNYKYTNKVLKKLYKHSISQLPDGKSFQVFQQIAIKNRCNLKYLRYIKFQYNKPTKPILKLLEAKYPDVEYSLEKNNNNNT